MISIVRQFAPSNWDFGQGSQDNVSSYTEEYKQIMYEVRCATDHDDLRPRRVIRVQDLHSYGQFLIREQLLINSNDNQLYRVRRYLQISSFYLNEIVKYNADPRRTGLGQSLTFSKKLNSLDTNRLIVVVKALTTEPHNDQFNPKTSCDYYVEYIIEVQN